MPYDIEIPLDFPTVPFDGTGRPVPTTRPTDPDDVKRFLRVEHPEYKEYVGTTRLILDTLESGERYRHADYGVDRHGRRVRNLARQRREYPMRPVANTNEYGERIPNLPSNDDILEYNRAIEDEYALRLERTPVPTFLESFINAQLSTIYKEEITQKGPAELVAWYENIDGRNTTLKEWLEGTLGQLLLALGMIDVYIDHPPAPTGMPIRSQADAIAANLYRAVARFILPENIPWWVLDPTGRYYEEIRVKEYFLDQSRNVYQCRQRHWNERDWVLWDDDGKVVDRGDHPFGMVPIIRVFDRRNFRCDHVGKSRYMGIVDKSREYYNEESEIITLSTMHNAPLLEGPEDDDPAGAGSIPIGPNFMLIKRRDIEMKTYVGFGYVQPGTQNLEFSRQRLADLKGRMHEEIAMTRSVGAVPVGEKGTVAQSGISKAFDQDEADKILAGISKRLQAAHYDISMLALVVLHDGVIPPASRDAVHVVYPARFNLLRFEDIAGMSAAIQAFIDGGIGKIPELEKRTLRLMYRGMLVGLDAEEYQKIDGEIDELVDAAVKSRAGSLIAPGPPGATTQPPAGAQATLKNTLIQDRTNPINAPVGEITGIQGS